MSRGLEALHHPRIELAKIDISAEGEHDIAYMPFYETKQYAAIEQELKDYEYWLKFVKCYGDITATDLQRIIHNGWVYDQTGYKEVDAFNLLKEKQVDIPLFIRCRKLEDYNGICIVNGSSQLTQEEYNSLKEVLR